MILTKNILDKAIAIPILYKKKISFYQSLGTAIKNI